MPTDLLIALCVALLGLVLSCLERARTFGIVLLVLGLGMSLALGRRQVLEPGEFARKARGLPADHFKALEWVHGQLVKGETVLCGLPDPVLPEARVSPSVLKAFWHTGWVDLLDPQTAFLVFDRKLVSQLFLKGLNRRWLRLGPISGTIQPCEIIPIPRVAALSQPPFRSNVKLKRGPYRPGEIVTFPCELFNATNESRRLGWVEVEVEDVSFRRLAGYNPLPPRSGEVVELVFVAPENAGGYQVTVTMPATVSGAPEVLARRAIEVSGRP